MDNDQLEMLCDMITVDGQSRENLGKTSELRTVKFTSLIVITSL